MTRPSPSRFDPPPVEIEDTVRWALLRAFGPADIGGVPPPAPQDALARAGALGLAPRIASRTAREQMIRELGEGVAAAFAKQAGKALQATLAYEVLAETVTEQATRLGSPVVFLKGYALHAAGHATPGSRQVGDLDLLVAEDCVRRLHEELRRIGFRPAPGVGNEQHLPPLAAPGWGVVDLHHAVRGVCDETETWLGASAVLSDSGAREVLPGGWVPSPSVLAAHALAHAIEQHASNPRPYPLLRMVADLQDLLPDNDAWDSATPRLLSLLGPTIEPAEIEAGRDLTSMLSVGRLPAVSLPAAHGLLAHFLAHALDPDYRASLGGAHLRHRLRQARQRGTLLRYARRKLLDRWRRATKS